jgi:hypothetical protein
MRADWAIRVPAMVLYWASMMFDDTRETHEDDTRSRTGLSELEQLLEISIHILTIESKGQIDLLYYDYRFAPSNVITLHYMFGVGG